MAFIASSSRPWLSQGLSQLANSKMSVSRGTRGRTEMEPAEADNSATGLLAFLEHERPYLLPDHLLCAAIQNEKVTSVGEVSPTTGPKGLDGAHGIASTIPYDLYGDGEACDVDLRSDSVNFRVAPGIDEASLRSMSDANSVEEFAKAVGIRLPRIIAGPLAAPPGSSTTTPPTYNHFEALRWAVARDAGKADYGLRLHNLARIVCHAYVFRTKSEAARRTSAMGYPRTMVSNLLTAELPTVSLPDYQAKCWVYIADELDPRYRAFLWMGVRGMHHYVADDQHSMYSSLESGPEALTEEVCFVRQSGDSPAPPTADDFLAVLSNPELALAYYYAYASSVGVNHASTQVLLQTVHMPYLSCDGENYVLPYCSRSPKLDGATYLLRPTGAIPPSQVLLNAGRVVYSAPLVCQRFWTGVGALLGGFAGGRGVSTPDVIAQAVGIMSDRVTSREVLRSVWACVSGGYAALEWMDPFASSVNGAYELAIEAYRKHVHLLAQARTTPGRVLAPVFTTGVDMTDAIPGLGAHGSGEARYLESVVYGLIAAEPVRCWFEPSAAVSQQAAAASQLARSWRAVVTWVRYSAEEIAKPKPRRSSSQARGPAPEITRVDTPTVPVLSFAHIVPPTTSGQWPADTASQASAPTVKPTPQRPSTPTTTAG
ncbi:ORF4, partial [Penicillium janczewskii chrysovirus 2]